MLGVDLSWLNSYSKQHGLYQALKASGQILKSHFILRVIDEPTLRTAIERVLNGIEHVHRFTRAVSVGNPREFLQAEKQEQEIAEACKRLIKNCIICWNYLYLSQKLAEMDDPAAPGSDSERIDPWFCSSLAACQPSGRARLFGGSIAGYGRY